MTEPEKTPKIELPDVLMILGLVLLFVGLGFAVSWPVAATVTGAVLIGLAVWLVEPPRSRKDKA
jgi:uncharacterized membrane protein HdeD (DUF308 family)